MLQEVMGLARRAIDDYDMIDENDKIAIGLSGGKDSLTMVHAIYNLKRYYPKKFDIMAITIHPGSDTFKTDELEKLCDELGIEYVIYNSNITKVVFDIRKEKNPCSLCANMRRGMLNSIAIEHGCTKIALAHHMDDVIETFLMSILLNGKVHTFSPVTYLSRSDVKVIRPFIYVPEKDIRATARKLNYPVVGKCCPMDGYTKREYTKNLIHTLSKDIPKVKSHIFGAIKRSNIKGWEIKEKPNN